MKQSHNRILNMIYLITILIVLLLISISSFASEPNFTSTRNTDRLISQIEQIIGKKDFVLALQIAYACNKHKVPCEIYAAILAKESMFNVKAVNNKSKDYGIAQINTKTIDNLNLDKNRLLSDRQYSIDKGAQVLSWFYARYKYKEPTTWYCRFNVGTGKLVDGRESQCKTYKTGVDKYLLKKTKVTGSRTDKYI